MENTSKNLFNLLVSKDFTIKTLDSTGKEQPNLDEVEMFSFDFEANDKNFGTVVILLNGDGQMELFYGDNIGKAMDRQEKKTWQDLLYQLRMFSKRNMMGFKLQNINRLKYSMQGMASMNESFENIFEGYYGTKKTSYNPQGKAKIIIKHSKNIGENDKRYRNVKSIFIENENGERFKLPFKKLVGARAMARHVTEGGNPYDIFGLHISEMVDNIGTLGKFMRRSKMFEDDDETSSLVETGRTHYDSMRKDLKRISGKRGYHMYKEGWTPADINEADVDVDSIRQLFTEKSLNQNVDNALPLLARLAENMPEVVLDDIEPEKEHVEPRMDEVNEFAEWADDLVSGKPIVEGTWSLPEDDIAMNELIEFFSVEQPAGIDAMDVTTKLYNIIGDDTLFDNLGHFADENPEGDTRPIVLNWIDDFVNTYPDHPAAQRLEQAGPEIEEMLSGGATQEPEIKEGKDLDSDEQCISHDDDDKITNKGDGMENFSDYVEEADDGPNVTLEETPDLTALMQRTKFLLHK